MVVVGSLSHSIVWPLGSLVENGSVGWQISQSNGDGLEIEAERDSGKDYLAFIYFGSFVFFSL